MAYCKFTDKPIEKEKSMQKIVTYVSNKNKTKNPKAAKIGHELLINYIANKAKTKNPVHIKNNDVDSLSDEQLANEIFLHDNMYIPGEDTTNEQEYFVTGFGCTRENACKVMLEAQQVNNNKAKYIAFHAVQSFYESPEEMSPADAHEIGKRLAEKLLADKYIVLVATHVNTEHCHNHFVICSTSPYTGKIYPKGDKALDDIRSVSDELCREYGLHVIKSTERKYQQKLNRGEIYASKKGEPTHRELLCRDIDEAITLAYSWDDFIRIMDRMGYTFKVTKTYVTIFAGYAENGMRLKDSLGRGDMKGQYTPEKIRHRIANKTLEQLELQAEARRNPLPTMPRMRFKGCAKNARPTGFSGLRTEYYRFCYRMTISPKLYKRRKRKRISPYLRSEINKFNKYQREMYLLATKNIRTIPELRMYREALTSSLSEHDEGRKILRNLLRKCADTETAEQLREEISEIGKEMKSLRRKIKLCDDIEQNSTRIKSITDNDTFLEAKQLEENRHYTKQKGRFKNEY